MKRVLIYLLSFTAVCINASDFVIENAGLVEKSETIQIASWNIRNISNRSRDDQELQHIADIAIMYDLIAVQEVRDLEVIDRLLELMPGYASVASDPVGRRQKEYYVFLFRNELINCTGTFHYDDADDFFIREPFSASFLAGTFDFTLVTVHLLYGDSKRQRREELVLLDDALEYFDEADGSERDLILLGDFNFDSSDTGWQLPEHTFLFDSSIKTTITDTSSYDNIIFHPAFTGHEYAGNSRAYAFDVLHFQDDDKSARLAVSDHRPVSAEFYIDAGDDD